MTRVILFEHAVMNNILSKICGIQTPEQAEDAANAGADFIGLVFHPSSKRCVTLDIAKKITKVLKTHATIPVAVFVDHSASQMQTICHATNIHVVQLHGASRFVHAALPTHYQRIYVQSVTTDGKVIAEHPTDLDLARDYLLFDNVNAGCGIPFDWHTLPVDRQFRVGLAGGLTAKNVGHAIQAVKPNVVDVSTGVENAAGHKEKNLIQEFIQAVQAEVRR